MSKKISVALLFGGRSAEHEISLISASAIYRNLDRSKFDVRSIYITRAGLWKPVDAPLKDPAALEGGPAFSFLPWEAGGPLPGLAADIYFPVLHGPYGEDGTIQGLLEMAGVPYVGAGVTGSALGMDKAVAKAVLRDCGRRSSPRSPWPRRRRADPASVLRRPAPLPRRSSPPANLA
jgi:D-alanine-D-alanine ligase